MFKAFVSFKIIMTALKQGEKPDSVLFEISFKMAHTNCTASHNSVVIFAFLFVFQSFDNLILSDPMICHSKSTSALVPVFSAIIILVFVTCIAAVFAVHLFHKVDDWNFGVF